MKFGYTIIYVHDVIASLAFFSEAFNIKTRFFHEAGYGELETGETTLAFASHHLGAHNLPNGYVAADSSSQPLGMEIALVTDSVQQAHEQAVAAGAQSIQEPMEKPWGQLVSYVRCPDGTLVELCSPLS
ncbi:VOC family protein [Legionella sp. WA2022007384]